MDHWQQTFYELKRIIPSARISEKNSDLQNHSKDKSFHPPHLPEIVIWPITTKEVSSILKIANTAKISVTAWGGGSSLEGNPIPTNGGIILDMTKMNKILKVYKNDLQIAVQPGILGEELDKKLKKYRLWFAAAPGSKHIATIGGMIANNAGGMHAVKYGVVGESVLKLTVVLANGDIMQVGSRSFKSVSGYDLKHLVIGSEGTLGIITEAVLKLNPIPEAKIACLISCSSSQQAAEINLEILQTNNKPASIEFMDREYITLVNKATNAKLPENPTLLLEFHGDKKIMQQQLKQILILCKNKNSIKISTFTTKKQLTLLWKYRRAVRPIVSTLLPNTGILSAEVGLPISQIGTFLEKTKQLSKKYDIKTVMFGHMGDGNFHGWALYTLGDKKSWEKVSKLNNELIVLAIKLGGTTTGEHGIGIGKRKFLELEHASSLRYMKQIKKMFDPNNILNPGKIFLP
ncbi:MAG TPA: FAD-binding oxidoreductase [Patescibacteria group bacterium]